MTCGAVEAECTCILDEGHELPHKCTRDGCLGEWYYDEDGEFVPVVFPTGERSPLEVMLHMLGIE